MSPSRILVIDAGTTGTRAVIFDENSAVLAQSYTEFPQYRPGSDRVEHDAQEIWEATHAMIAKALSKAALAAEDITAVHDRGQIGYPQLGLGSLATVSVVSESGSAGLGNCQFY